MIALSTFAIAAGVKPRITGIYSDLRYNQEGGDLLGTEIFIVYADHDDYFAFVQCWEGGTTPPVVVPVKSTEDMISFTVPEPSLGAGSYEGRVTEAGFSGVLTRVPAGGEAKKEHFDLKRKKSHWQ